MTGEAAVSSPFGDEPIEDVILAEAPLARVLAQVRFPRLTTLAANDQVALQIAQALSSTYPLFSEQQGISLSFGPEGFSGPQQTNRLWQLHSADKSWQVSIGDTFIALDTAAYSTRSNFIERFNEVVTAFLSVAKPPFCERIGIRYINRIGDATVLADLRTLVRPEVLGGLAISGGDSYLQYSVTESLYQFSENAGLQARWGLFPPGAFLDPTVQPLPTRSWTLDMDSFETGKLPVDVVQLGSMADELARNAYRFFRWIVTPEFLQRHGASS